MPIKTILVPLDGSASARSVLQLAFAVVDDLGAHADVLHVRANPKDVVPLLGEGMSGAMIEEMFDLAEKEAADRAAEARSLFDAEIEKTNLRKDAEPGAGASASWYEDVGREDEIIAERGRFADLVVVGQPVSEGDSSLLTFNAALFETGRPALVTPHGWDPKPLGRNVAISWNGSIQSARAVAGAMTFITAADQVTVFTAQSGKTGPATASQLVEYLAWHDVSAAVRTFEPGGSATGDVLLNEITATSADLIVMGAYTHSRMRQLILGGVTRHVLAEMTLPVLMAH